MNMMKRGAILVELVIHFSYKYCRQFVRRPLTESAAKSFDARALSQQFFLHITDVDGVEGRAGLY